MVNIENKEREVRLAVFASGTGTNFKALQTAIASRGFNAKIVRLIVDKENTGASHLAEQFGIPITVIRYADFANKVDAEIHIIQQLQADQVDGILLAGYMRILTTTLLDAFPQKIINIHPAWLPHFPGRHGIQDAFDAHVQETGVTIHYVDSGVDTGTIIAQQKVPRYSTDTLETLEQRIHQVEHTLYPDTLEKLLDEGVFLK